MSPDSLKPSATRRAWRTLSALGCVLGAASILLTAVKWTDTDTRQDRQARIANRGICTIVAYAEDASSRALEAARHAPTAGVRRRSLAAHDSLNQLASGMRRTGLPCPPRAQP
jgi:hypothetical protein